MRRGAIGLVLCISTGMAYGEAQGINPVLNEPFTLRLGANFLTVDGDLGSGTDNGNLPDIDIDTLGVDKDETSLYFAARWRPSNRWMIKLDYFGFDNSGDVMRPFLDFGEIGAIGTIRVETKLKTDFYVLQAGYSLLKNERVDLGLGLGLHVIDFDTSLRVTGKLGDYTGKIGTEKTDGDYSGSLFRGTINLEYRFTDHIGAGIGYNYTNMNLDIDVDDDDITSEYDLNYTGPVVFVSAGF